MENLVLKISKTVFGTVMGLILALIFLFESMDYSCKKTFAFSNKIMLLIAVILFITVYFALRFCSQRICLKGKTHIQLSADKIIRIATVCLLLVQIYIAYNILFETDWDSGGILRYVRGFISGNNLDEYGEWYFSVYPNNFFLLFYELFVLKLNSVLGIFVGQQQLMCLVIINCVLNSAACYLVYKIALLYVKMPFAVLGFVLAVMSFGLSPWTVICYSDQIGIIIPIFSFYFFKKPVSGKYKKVIYLALSFQVAGIGYFIKPQICIIFIAMVGIEILKLFRKKEKTEWKRILIISVTMIFTFAAIQTGINLASKKYSINCDPQKKFGMAHFFAMGLNEVERGVYSQEDVNFSNSIPTVKERNSANIEKGLSRLKNMGFKGAARFYAGKMLTVYNDGTFAWGYEGKFYATEYPEPNLRAAPFLRNIYCKNGKANSAVITVQQFVWIAILLLSFVSAFVNAEGNKNSELMVLMISIIGLTVFELLFEARARYLYTYVPIFCLLAAVGASNIYRIFDKFTKKSPAVEPIPAERR